MRDRLYTVLSHTCTALEELRRPGAAGALSGILADCWRAFLGPKELAFLAATGAQACDVEFQAKLEKALRADELRRHWSRQDWELHEWQRQRCVEAVAAMKADRLKWGTPPRWVADGSLLGAVE